MQASFVFTWVGMRYFLIYTLAQLVMLYYIALSSAASVHTPWKTVRDYVVEHQAVLLLRWLIATILFFAVWDEPQFVNDIAAWAGINLGWQFRLQGWSAAALGVMSDQLADIAITAAGWAKAKILAKLGKG